MEAKQIEREPGSCQFIFLSLASAFERERPFRILVAFWYG
jgi:hypothetical protein